MKLLIILLISFSAMAAKKKLFPQKRMAIVIDGLVKNVAIWDGNSLWKPCDLNSSCHTIEIPSGSKIDIGWSCSNWLDINSCSAPDPGPQ